MDHNFILIEDDEFIRDIYVAELEAAGFKIDAFATGYAGLEAITKKDYHILLLDIMLPDINGLQILKKLKSDDKTKDIRVILLSNLGQDEVIKEGLSLGAESYLVKLSYNPDQLVAEIKKIINKEPLPKK